MERSRKSTIEEFKSSSDFSEAIENAASKYFGKVFDFCKRQLRHHHPDLAIDLEEMGLDHNLLVKKDDDAEGEGADEETVEKGDANSQGDENPPPL